MGEKKERKGGREGGEGRGRCVFDVEGWGAGRGEEGEVGRWNGRMERVGRER